MDDLAHLKQPSALAAIWEHTRALGFAQPSDAHTGAFLRTLAAAKPGGRMLELGSGTGLATAWLLDGMDAQSHLITVEQDAGPLAVLRGHLCPDPRLTVVEADGDVYLPTLRGQTFDLIFADTWPGKYRLLDETLGMLKPGGFYLIDDMLPQPNWPEGHAQKAAQLITVLEQHPGFHLTKMAWASGLILATRISPRG